MPKAASEPQAAGRPHTLIVHHRSGFGDLVWHVPSIRAIAATSRDGRVTLMARPSCKAADLLAAEPSIEEVIEYDYRPRPGESRRARDAGLAGFLRVLALVRSRRFDRVYIFSSRLRYALLAWLAGIPRRSGFGFSWLERRALNVGPYIRPYAGSGSWVHWEATGFARAHGFIEVAEAPRIVVPAALFSDVLCRLSPLPMPRVALAIGTSQRNKDWGVKNFTRLAKALHERGFGVVVVGGPAEAQIADRLLAGIGRLEGVVAMCNASVLQSAAALKVCDLCIGNDTGALNLSAAAGVRCIGLFGHTKPLLHDPLIAAIEAPSMDAISLEAVLREVDAFEASGAHNHRRLAAADRAGNSSA